MANERNQSRMPIISDFHYGVIMKNADRLNNAIKHERDFTYSYFGFKVCVFHQLCSLFNVIFLYIYIYNFRHLKNHIY